ncbi:YbbR-like domain-containing protein [Winogradskyella sp. PC D3.3]
MNILDHLKKKKVKQFSLFFVVAFVFLIFSKLSNDYKQTIKLKINLVNVDDEILLINDSTNYIQAYVEAKGFALMPFIFNNSKVLDIDAKSDVTIKSDNYIFDVAKHKYLIESQLGNAYDLISIMPDTLLIAYSKRASKTVPITFNKAINFAVGYDLKGEYNFDIDSVKVVGSEEEVNKIKALTTQKLVLNDVKNDIESVVSLDVSAYHNIDIFPKTIMVTGKVARFTEGIIEVPIVITNQPENVVINYFPKTVTLSYYVDLENYNAVKALDFKVECDYAKLEENQTFLIPNVVKKPAFVKHINIKQKQIDFIEL